MDKKIAKLIDKKEDMTSVEMDKRIQAIEEKLEDHAKRIKVLELYKAI